MLFVEVPHCSFASHLLLISHPLLRLTFLVVHHHEIVKDRELVSQFLTGFVHGSDMVEPG